jgi:hypothetical protein
MSQIYRIIKFRKSMTVANQFVRSFNSENFKFLHEKIRDNCVQVKNVFQEQFCYQKMTGFEASKSEKS